MVTDKKISKRFEVKTLLDRERFWEFCYAYDSREKREVLLLLLTEEIQKYSLNVLLRYRRLQEKLKKVQHENILHVCDTGNEAESSYTIYENAAGKMLGDVQATYSQEESINVLTGIAYGLAVAHEHKILHGCINPWRIMLVDEGGRYIPKIIGFGGDLLVDFLKVKEEQEIKRIFGYLAPEATGILKKPVDERSDLYSLGVLFYELVCGRVPYSSSDISELIHQHIAQLPEPPSRIAPAVSPAIEKIILRLLAKDPQDRYQSARGLIADLDEYQKQKQAGKESYEIDFAVGRQDRVKELTFTSKLIGRDQELKTLKNMLVNTRKGQGGFCVVHGEPGIGKSRLIDELRAEVHSFHGIFIGGKCYQYEFRTPYKVFAEIVEAYVEKVKRVTAAEQEKHRKRLREVVGELGGELVKIAPCVTELIGEPPALVELEPEKERVRFLITVTNFLSSLGSAEAPLLMFLDDLQWVDDGSLDIVERVVQKLSSAHLLLIASFRDTEVDQTHPFARKLKKFSEEKINFCDIALKAFSPKETSQMVGQILLEQEEVIAGLANVLQERTNGNPFFILELLRTFAGEQVIYFKDNHYLYDSQKLNMIQLPATIVEVVLKRMQEISAEEKQILSYASVLGSEVNIDLLTELSRRPIEEVSQIMENGITGQFLYRDITGKENIFFMHDRVREAFCQLIPPEEKMLLHRHIAQALEEQYKDNPDKVIYELAHHYKEGLVEEKALVYSLQGGKKAQENYGYSLAISLYSTAKDVLEKQRKQQTPDYLHTMESLGEVYRFIGQFDASVDALKICLKFITPADVMRKVQVYSKMGSTLADNGKNTEACAVLEEALGLLGVRIPKTSITIFLGIGPEFIKQIFHIWFPWYFISPKTVSDKKRKTIIQMLVTLGRLNYLLDMNKTFYLYLKALNIAQRLGPSPELAFAYSYGGPVWCTFPWFSRALRSLADSFKMAQKVNDKIQQGIAHAYSCYVLYHANNPAAGLEHGQKGIGILLKLGEYWCLGTAYCFRNHNNWISGKLDIALQHAEEFLTIMRKADVRQCTGWALGTLARIKAMKGCLDEEIVKEAEEAEKLAKETNDKSNTVNFPFYTAYVHLRMKNYEKAMAKVEEAATLFPKNYNKGPWILDMFSGGAQIYLDAMTNVNDLSSVRCKHYLKRARWYILQARKWSMLYKFFTGWTYQVWGTYNWHCGRKKRAEKLWDKGVRWLRTNKNNPGGDKYRIAYLLLEEARFLLQDDPKSKKGYENLIEARELFESMDCRLDLQTTIDLLARIIPEEAQVDSREALTARRHLDSLLNVAQAIGSIFKMEELFDKVMEYAIKVTGAERGFLLLYGGEQGSLELKVSQGLEKELEERVFSYQDYKISLDLIKTIEEKQAAVMITPGEDLEAKIEEELKSYQVKQALAVPLKTQEKLLGVLYLDNRLAGGTFGKEELELMKAFSVQASVSIENTRLVGNMMEQERLKQEMELGRDIQMNLLPKRAPQVAGLSVSGLMIPAKEIGGDYYDYIFTSGRVVEVQQGETVSGKVVEQEAKAPDCTTEPLYHSTTNKLGIVIGDVSGKGVAAGLIMATAKATLKGLSEQGLTPKQTLCKANSILHEYTKGEKFMTMLYLQWDIVEKRMRYSSAGHEHIIIYRSKDSSSEIVEKIQSTTNYKLQSTNSPCVEVIPSGGFMLGMLPEIEEYLEDREIPFKLGDKVVLYTDGVTEAHNEQDEMYSLEKLVKVVEQHGHQGADELIGSIKQQVYNFIGSKPQYDDITLVVMECEAEKK